MILSLGFKPFAATMRTTLDAWPNACILPSWVVSRVCLVPCGATPSYAHGYYARDNRFYLAWDKISRKRETFTEWIDANIHGTADFAQYLEGLQPEPVEEAR